jgi:hypothetical protein
MVVDGNMSKEQLRAQLHQDGLKREDNNGSYTDVIELLTSQ